MSSILKKNNPVNYILIFIIGGLVWLPGFFFTSEIQSLSKHYSLIYKTLNTSLLNIYLNKSIAFAMVYFVSVYLIHINQRFSLVEGSYQLPGIFFMLLTGLSFNVQQLSPGLIAGLFILIATKRIITIYHKPNILPNCFDAGFFIAIASLIYTQAVSYFIVIILALLIIRPFNLREYLSVFLGFVTPVAIFISLLFLFDKENLFFNNFLSFFPFKYYPEKFNFFYIVSFFPILFIGLYVMLFQFAENSFKKIVTRKQLTIVSLFLIISFISFLLPINNFLNEFFIMLIPLSLLFAFYFANNKSAFMRKFIAYLIILNLLSAQILQVFNYLDFQF
jgi:hypothetical protein